MTGILTTNDSLIGQRLGLLTASRGQPADVEVIDATLFDTGDSLLAPELFDDFQSGSVTLTAVGAGAQLRGGLGNTGWLGVFQGATAGTVWQGIGASSAPGQIGVARLGTGTTAAAVASICRGYSATDLPLKVRDIRQLDYLIAADGAGVLDKFAYVGLNSNWAALSGLMGLQANTPGQPNWTLRRSGEADVPTLIPVVTGEPVFVRFQQRQAAAPPNGLGLGSGIWDLFIATAASPTLTTPVVAGFGGGAVGGNPTADTNYGAQVQLFGTPTHLDIDAVRFRAYPQTLEQRLAP